MTDPLKGFVSLWRGLLESRLWQESTPLQLKVYLWLLLRSNYRRSSWRSIRLAPGQVWVSRQSLARGVACTPKQARTALERLVALRVIRCETYGRTGRRPPRGVVGGTLVTINNYEARVPKHPERDQGAKAGGAEGPEKRGSCDRSKMRPGQGPNSRAKVGANARAGFRDSRAQRRGHSGIKEGNGQPVAGAPGSPSRGGTLHEEARRSEERLARLAAEAELARGGRGARVR